jgi:hypothetical protein
LSFIKEAKMCAWLVVLSALCAQSAAARQAAREVVEAFGREAIEAAEPRVARLVELYGEEAAGVLRKVGPPGVHVLEQYGAPGLRILGRWGEEGMRLLAVEGEAAVASLARYGDGAVELMIRHPGVGRDLVDRFGSMVLRTHLSTDRMIALDRLAGPIENSGRSAEIFRVVETYGDRACDFLWRNKGTIFAASVLAAFLHDPKPYLDGVRELVVQPASQVAQGAVARTNWTLVVLAGGAAAALWLGLRWGWRPRLSGRRSEP